MGVLASKAGQIRVEIDYASGGDESDAPLDRFQTVWGSVWVPGRFTLTRLHLTFVPGRGAVMLDIPLRNLVSVELSGAPMSRQISLQTGRHLTRVRLRGAPALATRVAELAEAARQRPRRVIC